MSWFGLSCQNFSVLVNFLRSFSALPQLEVLGKHFAAYVTVPYFKETVAYQTKKSHKRKSCWQFESGCKNLNLSNIPTMKTYYEESRKGLSIQIYRLPSSILRGQVSNKMQVSFLFMVSAGSKSSGIVRFTMDGGHMHHPLNSYFNVTWDLCSSRWQPSITLSGRSEQTLLIKICTDQI